TRSREAAPALRNNPGAAAAPMPSAVRVRNCLRLMAIINLLVETPMRTLRPSPLPPQLGIEHVAQPVAEQVDAEHGDKNRQAGKDRQPRRAIDVAPPFAQH